VPNTYQTPGVYIEWLDRNAQQIVVGRTDVAGFVGLAGRGPIQTPIKIESYRQFVSTFGDVTEDAYLAYAVGGFFDNGGRTCWVVRVANPAGATPASSRLTIAGGTPFVVVATSPGAWGNSIEIEAIWDGDRIARLNAMAPGLPPRIITLPSPRSDSGGAQPFTNLLGVSDSQLPDTSPAIVQVQPDTGGPGVVINLTAAQGLTRLAGGADGDRDVTPAHFTDVVGGQECGITALERIDGISFVALPDLLAPAPGIGRIGTQRRFDDGPLIDAQLNVIASCARCGDRVAILDAPGGSANVVQRHRASLPQSPIAASFAAIYHPWLAVRDALGLNGLVRFVPPSGHVAGMFARTDRLRGVHKPPANEVLEGVYDVADRLDDNLHGLLNNQGINAIRIVPGRGVLVLGARTLSDDVRWRYVNVRRLFAMIEEALDEQMQWATFEPNNPQLWRHIDRTVRGFLERLYRAGMLDGESSDDAYLVRCDESTNPPIETDLGQVTCVVGLQPPYPAEFVVVRIGVTRSGIEIEERGAQDV
jgi:phage tail sheath protein FI